MSSIFMGKPDEPKSGPPGRAFQLQYHDGTHDIIEAHTIHFNNTMVALWESTQDQNNRLILAINTEMVDTITELS